LLVTGDAFPDSILLYNNTLSPQSTEPLTLTSVYITDSEGNTYLDTDSNTTISKKMNIKANLLIKFTHPIQNKEYVQINLQDTNNESYDIVLYNNNESIVITYSANVDSSAFVLSKTSVKKREPCRAEFHKPLFHPSASFMSSSIWTNGSTLKVGFMGGQEWQQAYIGYIVQKYVTPLVNLTFQFIIGQIPPTDTSYQIRISFDEKGGSYSLMGKESSMITYQPSSATPIVPQPASMNFGWTDAPFNYSFLFNGKRYTI
jgi:hypothetical protein